MIISIITILISDNNNKKKKKNSNNKNDNNNSDSDNNNGNNNNNNNNNNNDKRNNNTIFHLWQREPRTSSAVGSCEAWCADAAVAVCLVHTGSREMTGTGCALVYICKLR